MARILIGCRLPNGLLLQHPDKEKREAVSVKLKGAREETIVGSGYGLTDVDADFWETWKKAYPDYQPLKTGALFEANSASVAKDKAKELKDQSTGFEPMKKDAGGVKPAEKE